MFSRIIVATDLTAATRMSLRAACDLRQSQGEIWLVHVIRRLAGLPEAELRGVYDRLKSDAGTKMLDLKSWFTRERHLDIECISVIGSPAQEIARLAGEREADLIVLAHDAADDPAILGSVSFKVAQLAPCAVLMLKAPGTVKAVRRRHTSSGISPATAKRPGAASGREAGGVR
jgi:nucleotide-binding universal stress UspA family protein